ncbi:MAG: dephospho-CoA kinase [Limisphaerales bacterium]
MIKVGVTGGIGSGKTTICKMFETLCVPIYYADYRAKQLMVEDALLVEQIKTRFGNDIYNLDGDLNRSGLASIVFSDKGALADLNQLVHPAVFRDSIDWTEQHAEYPYTIKEAALLFESGSYKMLDKIVAVYAPQELRIKRVVHRDNTNKEEVLKRIEKQWPDEKKVALADFVIYNDGTQSLIAQVWELHLMLSR